MTTIVTTNVDSPEQVMANARQGSLSKDALAGFLAIGTREEFLKQCAAIEKRFTEACTATGDPCLEGGCAVEGEVCLQPLLNAGVDYAKACGEAFVTLYVDERNRT
jgi:hypothetical protein